MKKCTGGIEIIIRSCFLEGDPINSTPKIIAGIYFEFFSGLNT